MIRFKRTFTEPFPKDREDSYVKAGIIPFHGPARFVGSNTVKVGYDGNDRILDGRFILIADRSNAYESKHLGSENVITSDQFLEIEGDNLPNRIVFVGGGYISFEFAQVAARAGVEVTILHRGKKPLERFDRDLVNQLVQKGKEIGIDLQVQRAVKGIDKSSDGKLFVHASDGGL